MMSIEPEPDGVVNVSATLQRLGGDVELMRDMAEFFLEDVPELLNAIRQGLQNGDAETVARSAHSIKGLAANFDAHKTETAARDVENAARNEDLVQVHRSLPVLTAASDDTFIALRRLVLE